ncbi:MAG: SpoIID/LytB domain-containing protein, partial [Terracidiphilus sp.]
MKGRIFAIGGGLMLAAMLTSAAFGQSTATSLHARSTLRVGLWTLWHDKEIAVATAADMPATLRMCDGCEPVRLVRVTRIRAAGERLEVGDARQAIVASIEGSVTLSAHGESITLRNPLRISVRNGVLLLTVTLPVETYVERVVASESGPADTPESLKALAIVARSFALHQPHG